LADLCPEKNLAWDSACGNGQAAIGLAEEFNKVYATDISNEQIANSKYHSKIDYVVSSSEKTLLENESCDLVSVAQALHWFDYDLFWPEVNRVLKPQGIFTTFGYTWPSINNKIDELVSTSFLKVIEPYWAPQNALLLNHYRGDSPNFIMQENWNLNDFFNFLHTFSATRRCMDAIGIRFFDDAYENVVKIWGDREEKKTVSFEFVFYAGRKKK